METLTSANPLATYLPTLNHRMREISSSKRVFLTQHMLMRILRVRAKSMPLITIRYNCGVVELTQDDSQVLAKTTTGVITAKYCVGCDGAAGITRRTVTGNEVSGHGLVGNSRTIVFRVFPNVALLIEADLTRYQKSYLNALIYVSNPAIRGLVRLDKSGESGMLVVYTTTRQITPEMLKDGRTSKARLASQILHDALGRRDMKIELLNGEDWTARSESADSISSFDHAELLDLQNGRIFLAGDAARQMAPTGTSYPNAF
jgi:2-polyprenyl-6-methoxyphenol hydroxylase-like FAD-dependent oxidoreductase